MVQNRNSRFIIILAIGLILLPLSFILTFADPVEAEMKTFIKEYSYQASEYDSKVSSRTIAIGQVKRLLLEELGTYLEANTEVKNFELNKDQIIALTGGIVHAKILEESWDGKNYWVKAEVRSDPEEVTKSIDRIRKDKKEALELELSKNKSDEALREIEKLRHEINALKEDKDAQQKFNRSVEALNVVDKESRDNSISKSNETTIKRSPKTQKKAVPVSSTYFVASSSSKKYHYPSCTWAKKISPRNRITFRSVKEARQAGYIPCKICKPPDTDI